MASQLRSHIRDGLTAIFVVLTVPFWAPVCLSGLGGRDVGLFVTCGQLLSLVPGVIGSFSRRAYYIMTLESCAVDVGVAFGTWFTKRRVAIAPRVSIGAHCLIGSCSVGEGSLFGSNVDVLSGRHQHATFVNGELRADQKGQFEQVYIGKNAWIGNRAVVMADIGDNSVIGAGSVVVHSVPPDAIAVGVPATVKKRLDSLY